MPECPTCGASTPPGRFCVRCGAPLDDQLEHSRQRGGFAAAPAQGRYAPWLVSTLFPHLPRHSERHFHIALSAGLTLAIALGALRLVGVALMAAAMLMPLLAVLYLYDVNIYESDPAWAYGWTLAWGAAAGIGLGLLSRAAASTGASLIDRGSDSHVLIGGIVVPVLGVAVSALGLLALLSRRRLTEVLDGTTLAAVTAATLAAAEAITVGVGVVRGGLRPPGAAWPWVARLVAIGVATPVLSMGAVASFGAALWLRYRAPVKDRAALGVLGRPGVALVLALALVVAGAIGETLMSAGTWLAWLVALDGLVLVILRRTLHVGLLEAASEREIGPPIHCANCDAETVTHTFCGNCGIALSALPKPRGASTSQGSYTGRMAAERRGRRSNHRRLGVSAAALGATLAAALAAAAVAAPGGVAPRCTRGVPCGVPPAGPSAPARYATWRSAGLGYSLRYNDHQWSVQGRGADGLALEPVGDQIGEITVSAVPAAERTPQALLSGRVGSLRGQLLGLVPDPMPSDQLLGTNVGFRPGPGAVYTATTATPQGPQDPIAIAILAAGNSRMSVVVTVIAAMNDVAERSTLYQSADDVIDSIQWPA